jgi:phospholipid transport system substrate-binding protein
MRKINFLILTIFMVISASSYNAEATTKEASNFISDLADRVINLVQNKNINDKQKEDKLNRIFLENVDTKWIARFSMGRYWRQLSTKQQDSFLNLYSEYLIGLYVPNFRKYTSGNIIKVKNSTQVIAKEYVVQTILVDPVSQSNIKIDYRLIQNDGFEKFVIFDIIAEGVSLITTQRAEINSVMASSGFKVLMDKLKQKTS